MAGPGKEYTLGKGRLFFNQFLPGTFTGNGERYLGNTPGFSVSQEVEKLEHIDSDEGINVKDESVTLSNDMTGLITTDNISNENVALWFGGDTTGTTVASAAGLTSALGTIVRGRTYQLGVSPSTPSGVRKVSAVIVTKLPSTVITASGNYVVDAARGTVTILANAAGLADGDDVSVGYSQDAYSRTVTVGKSNEVAGTLRFEATNPVGPKKDYFFPYVKLTSSGDYELKGEDWQQMEFEVEVLKRDSLTERVYIEAVPA